MNPLLILLTGLTVGGLTCLAVQGGLLASVIAVRESEVKTKTKNHALFATGIFLFAKLLSYTTLGFILGAFGGVINISGNVQTGMQLLAGLYMIAVALNLLDVHPIFRYVMIQPPRMLTRLVRNQAKSKDIFAPLILGVMTIFIPCGTTLGMEALAISSASPVTGASIMAVFTIGTIPLFFGIGFLTSILGDAYKVKFLKLAAVAVLYLGLTSVNGAFIAFGIPINSQTITESFNSLGRQENNKLQSQGAVTQNVEILVTSGGYSPDYILVKKGQPVTLTLKGQNAYSCASAFRIPSLGISKNLQANEVQTIVFTPEKVGKIILTCSMGMYSGVIEVI